MDLRNESIQTTVHAATLRQKLQIQLAVTHSQYTDSEHTSFSTDPIMLGAWQGSHPGTIAEDIGVT